MLELHRVDRHAYWTCKCICGTQKVIQGSLLLNGGTKSCGCLHKERTSAVKTTHGLRKSNLYPVWRSMKSRCYNPSNERYPDYGGRGIIFCDEWLDFQLFHSWALANGYKKGLSIERKDNDGNYCPVNCKWATSTEQNNNRRDNIQVLYQGKLQSFALLFSGDSVRRKKVWERIYRRGWDVDRAVDTP